MVYLLCVRLIIFKVWSPSHVISSDGSGIEWRYFPIWMLSFLSFFLFHWCTRARYNRIITAQLEGMGDVGSARYEPALLPPCLTIRVLSYSNGQRSTHSISKWILRNLALQELNSSCDNFFAGQYDTLPRRSIWSSPTHGDGQGKTGKCSRHYTFPFRGLRVMPAETQWIRR